MLVPSIALQNRAVNADIVAVQVLPKSQWVANFKSAAPTLAFMEDTEKLDKDEELEVNSANKTLMD